MRKRQDQEIDVADLKANSEERSNENVRANTEEEIIKELTERIHKMETHYSLN